MEEKVEFFRRKLKKELDNHKGPITLLFDFWSSLSRQAYLGVVYSYIDTELNPKHGILALKYFSGIIILSF